MLKNARVAAGCALVMLALVSTSFAQMFYVTAETTQRLDLVNFSTGQVTDIYNIGGRPDSLLITAGGQILYTVSSLGTLQMFNPTTHQDSVLANFGAASPRDMVFDPGGSSILISLYGTGKLARYNLVTGAVRIFPTKRLGASLDGLAYDPAGNLFAVVAHNTLCQVDPNTGAILQTLVLEPHLKVNGGDGLVYDSYTKNLWLTHDGTLGNGLIEIPLTESQPPRLGTPILLQTGNIHVPDGIISDGKGNLYIGEGLQDLTQYSIPSNTVVKRVLVKGIDSPAFVP
jgi:hypothetical protein